VFLQVPVACATYLDDMYVEYNLAQETLEGVPAVRQWVTNEFKHRWAAQHKLGAASAAWPFAAPPDIGACLCVAVQHSQSS
jgi:hypothetical protein